MWGGGVGGGVSVYVFFVCWLVGWLVGWLVVVVVCAWVWWCLNVTKAVGWLCFIISINFICWYVPSFIPFPKKPTNSSNVGHESSSSVVFYPHFWKGRVNDSFFRVCIKLSLVKSQVAFSALHAEHQHWGYRQGGLILDTNTVGGRSVVKNVALWTFELRWCR